MRLVVVACCILVLGACSTAPQPAVRALPFDVGNGHGGEFGNYGGYFDGETRDAAGDRCFVFNWDRPFNKDFAIRYTSASCESKEHPNWMTTTSYSRKIIPMAESHLKDEEDEGHQ